MRVNSIPGTFVLPLVFAGGYESLNLWLFSSRCSLGKRPMHLTPHSITPALIQHPVMIQHIILHFCVHKRSIPPTMDDKTPPENVVLKFPNAVLDGEAEGGCGQVFNCDVYLGAYIPHASRQESLEAAG